MKKFNIVIHYAGAFDVQVEAENEEQARIKAEQAFDEVSDNELIAGLADIHICDCWEEE